MTTEEPLLMSSPIIFYGGHRHLAPAQGYTTPTMSVLVPGESDHPPPWQQETYVRTDIRVEVGSSLGPAVVMVIAGCPESRDQIARVVRGWVAATPRVAEHFRFRETGEGRPWPR